MNPKQYPLYEITPALRIRALCSAFQCKREPQYSSSGELHDFWEAVFILDGEAEITANDTIYHLKAGQMIFHPPLEFHRLRNASEKMLEILIVSFVATHAPMKERRICAFPAREPITTYVKKLRQLFVTNGFLLSRVAPNSDSISIQRTVNEIENYFLDILCAAPSHTPAIEGLRAERYANAVTLMHQNLARRLSVTQLAALCSVSVSTLQKLFYSYTGMGAMQYYNNLRMHHARLLLSTHKSVKEVALLLGYEDQNYFSTVYRRHFGIPPSAENTDGRHA